MPKDQKTIELAETVVKLNNYIAQYTSRAMSIETSLGIPGMKYLEKSVKLAEEILEEIE